MSRIILFVAIILFETAVSGQETKKLSLADVIQIALSQSPESILAKHKLRNSYWSYRTYKAEFLPSLNLDATIPDINRSISRITMPDGSDAFIQRSVANSSLGLSVAQNLSFTGGKVFISSNLQRLDLLDDTVKTSFLSAPVSIGFIQPLFAYNSYKWLKKIEPVKYEEARREYILSLENISQKAVNSFFDLILAKINNDIAKINYSNNDTLYKIAKGRYNIGTIAQNELLQMELNFLSSGTSLNESGIALEIAKFRLRSFLGYNNNVEIELIIPHQIPSLTIDIATAKDEALKNNPQILNLEIQLLETESAVAKAKAENRFNANLYASYGLTQSALSASDAYKSPEEQMQMSFGVQMPVIDWGLGRGKYKMALSNQEVIKTTVNQAKIDFEQDVYLQVMQFNLQDENVKIAMKSDSIANNRYEITKQRFYIGKIDVTDLTIALTEKDGSKRAYISALRNYWNYYYTIRKLTLFDFENNTSLISKFDESLLN